MSPTVCSHVGLAVTGSLQEYRPTFRTAPIYRNYSYNYIKQCDKNRLQTTEMKYLQRTVGCTLLNHKRNEEIFELHVTPLEDELCTYRHKWFQHVHRMEDDRLPKQLLNYPKGRRWPGTPLKGY
jgi:hypothetical protein